MWWELSVIQTKDLIPLYFLLQWFHKLKKSIYWPWSPFMFRSVTPGEARVTDPFPGLSPLKLVLYHISRAFSGERAHLQLQREASITPTAPLTTCDSVSEWLIWPREWRITKVLGSMTQERSQPVRVCGLWTKSPAPGPLGLGILRCARYETQWGSASVAHSGNSVINTHFLPLLPPFPDLLSPSFIVLSGITSLMAPKFFLWVCFYFSA